MKRLLILAVAAFAFAGTLAATASSNKSTVQQKQPIPIHCTAKAFQPFSADVWRLGAWERGKPPEKVLKAQRRRLACAPPAHRKAMKHRWREDQAAFFAHRKKMLRRQEHEEALNPPGIATLEAIAACESGGDPTAVSADGTYRGKYQFDYGTWESVGGTGDPAAAPEWEQDERAAELYRRSGSSPWPICG